MELDKKKYKREEVEKLLADCRLQYESELKDLREREIELVEKNRKLSAEINVYKEKEKLVSETLLSAEKQAKSILNTAECKYQLEVEKLKDFARRWTSYFEYVVEKYPFYHVIKEAERLHKEICSILTVKRGSGAIKAVDKLFGENNSTEKFDPQKKINDYIAATSSNDGFNLEEVLNPGALKLEDLCKELGLIDED